MAWNFNRESLKPDCGQCDALCCSALSFEVPGYKKAMGVDCKNLDKIELNCGIYETREQLGYIACCNFDCFGAGQSVTKLFENLGELTASPEIWTKARLDVFMLVYLELSKFVNPERELGVQIVTDQHDKLEHLVDIALVTLAESLDASE